MAISNRRRTLRELFASGKLARAASARDGLGARLVEEAGFDAVWISSLELSASRALPDLGLLTMTECLQAAVAVRAATSLPLLVDCDTGYGGLKNLVRTVGEFESAGISGICVEDKVFPKRNSFLDGDQHLVDEVVFGGRITAARNARSTDDFVIVARCEALIAGAGLDEAVRRARRYEAAGADAILMHSKAPTPDEIVAFLARWESPTPVVVVPTTFSGWSADDAAKAGVAMMIYANQTLRASVLAMRSVLRRIHDEGAADGADDLMASIDDVFALTGVERWERLEP